VDDPTAVSKRAPGGPVLQDELTQALGQAFFEELAAVGYGRLSLEAVAKRANAGKSAIYRRWPSKRAMTVDLVSRVAVSSIRSPDTGSLHGDLMLYLKEANAVLSEPLVSRIVPDLLAEAARDTELAEALNEAIRVPRRDEAARMLLAAIARGEMAPDADIEIGLDFVAGPLYWRLAVTGMPIDAEYLEQLADKIVQALTP
jgi:AcrR family transcriptional regulator